jgi:hypothetical protein
MKRNRISHHGSFVATCPKGQKFRIDIFREVIGYPPPSDSDFCEGAVILRTDDGKRVRLVEKGVYQILELDDLTVRSSDWNAI